MSRPQRSSRHLVKSAHTRTHTHTHKALSIYPGHMPVLRSAAVDGERGAGGACLILSASEQHQASSSSSPLPLLRLRPEP